MRTRAVDYSRTPPSSSRRHLTNRLAGYAARSAGKVVGRYARSSYDSLRRRLSFGSGSRRNVSQASRRVVDAPTAASGHVQDSTGTRAPVFKRRHKKGVSFKKKKKVKVSRQFREKVNQALEPGRLHGTYIEIGNNLANDLDFQPLAFGNKQVLYNLGQTCNDQFLFNPMRILDACSVLWNNKTASENAKYAGAPTYTLPNGSFDPHTFNVKLVNSWAEFVIKNNSQRTWIIQLYTYSPKVNSQYFTNGTQSNGDAKAQWFNAMFDEANTPGTSTVNKPVNVSGATPNTLYAEPGMCRLLCTKWKFEKTDVVLAPGQTYDYRVQGPSNLQMDFQKYWNINAATGNQEFWDIQKSCTRGVFFTARLDVTNGGPTNAANGLAGRWADNVGNTGHGLKTEYRYYYKFDCAEQVAGSVFSSGVAANTPFTLSSTNTQRRDCYYLKHWNEAGNTAFDRVEELTDTVIANPN